MDEIRLLDVALLVNLRSEGLRRGEVGTVVEEWKDGVLKWSLVMILGRLMHLQHCAPTN